MTEDEMVEWHYQLNNHEFEQTPGDSEGQRSPVCCSPWGHKESDMNNNRAESPNWSPFLHSWPILHTTTFIWLPFFLAQNVQWPRLAHCA